METFAPPDGIDDLFRGLADVDIEQGRDLVDGKTKKERREERSDAAWERKRLRLKEKRKEARKRAREAKRVEPSDVLRAPQKNNVLPSSIQQDSRVHVVIDMHWSDIMSRKDINAIIKQLKLCYSANRRAERRLNVVVTSMPEIGRQLLGEKSWGYEAWDIEMTSQSYVDKYLSTPLSDAVGSPPAVVYLTGDSPNVLKALEADKHYIIGGLVDHNHMKEASLREAERHAIPHARLPIQESLSSPLRGRAIVTVNQCFEMILRAVNNGGDWKEAVEQVMPGRRWKG